MRAPPRRCLEYPHLTTVVRWEETLPGGVVASCSTDVYREAALAELYPDPEPIVWPWRRRES